MAYQEGQRLQGSDGKVYVVHGGMPVLESTIPIAPTVLGTPKPGFQYEGPKAAAQLAETQASVAHTQAETRRIVAQAPTDAAMAQANLTRAQADATVAAQKADEGKANAALANMTSNSNLHGEAYLKANVPPSQWNLVRAYARGDLGSRAGGMSTSMLPIIQHAMNYDPTASGVNFPARVKMQGDLAGSQPGTAGGQLQAIERQLLHGVDVLHAGQALGNTSAGIAAPLNYVRAGVRSWEQDPAQQTFTDAVGNYAPEAQKGISGGLGGEAERQARGAHFSAGMNPGAIAAALQADAKQAMGAADALNDRYKRIMGRDITDALSPAARAAYQELMAGGYDAQGKPLHPAPGWMTGAAEGGPGSQGGPPTPFDPFTAPGNGGGPSGTVATGATRFSPDPKASGMVVAMVKAGATDDQIDAALKAQGIAPVDRATTAAAREFLRQHPGADLTAKVGRQEAVTDAQRIGASAPAAFAGNAFNAALGGLPALATGGDQLAAASAAHGTASTLGNLVGGAAGAGATELGLGALGAKAALPSVAKLLSNPLTADSLYGGITGATSDPSDPVAGAILGTAGGAVGGVVGRKAVGPLIGAAARPVGRMFGAAPAPAPLSSADASLYKTVTGASLPNVTAQLDRAQALGVPYTLADTAPQLSQLAGAVVRRSPNASQFVDNVLSQRTAGQMDRLGTSVNTNLGQTANIPQLSASLSDRAKTTAGPLYDAAYAQPGASSVKLDDLATRPGFKSGMAWASKIAAEEGRDPTSLGFDIDPVTNEVTLNRVPSWQTLDYAKRGMDAALDAEGRDPLTGKLKLDTYTRALNDTRATLVGRLRTGNPTYRQALDAYAGPAAARDALMTGQDAFNPSLSPDQHGVQIASDPANLQQIQLGGRDALMTKAGNRAGGNPWAVLAPPNVQAKLGLQYPGNPSGVSNLLDQLGMEQNMARTNTTVLGGSQTAGRVIADSNFASSAPEIAGAVAGAALGHPVAAAKLGMFAAMRNGLNRMAVGKADALAPVLLNPDPAANLSYLTDLGNRADAYRAYVNNPYGVRRLSGMAFTGVPGALFGSAPSGP